MTRAEIADLLETSGQAFASTLDALPPAAASWHPKPGEWCVNECVGHIIEADRRGFGGRIRDILAGKPLVTWDQVQVERDRKDCDRVSQSLWMEFMGPRHDYITMVRALKPADLTKSGMHPKVGELHVSDLLHEWVSHDRNHTRQILAVQQERVYPHMGNSQKFKGE